MPQTQLNRFTIISKVIDGHMTITEAAVSLGISERQMISKLGRFINFKFAASLLF